MLVFDLIRLRPQYKPCLNQPSKCLYKATMHPRENFFNVVNLYGLHGMFFMFLNWKAVHNIVDVFCIINVPVEISITIAYYFSINSFKLREWF